MSAFMALLYVDVILPVPAGDKFTYRVPSGLESQISPGKRVIVPFGRKRSYSAIVLRLHQHTPENMEVKEIEALLDDAPVVYEIHLELWNWISRYYLCTLGEVMKAALPSGLKLESETVVFRNPEIDDRQFSPDELLISSSIADKKPTVGEIEKKLGSRFSYRVMKQMIEKQLLLVEEKITEKYKPKYRTTLALNPEIDTTAKWEEVIRSLKKAVRQQELMLHAEKTMKLFTPDQLAEISKTRLLEHTDFKETLLRQLIARKVFIVRSTGVSRIPGVWAEQESLHLLNEHQEKALDAIREQFRHKPVVLLHGVTASGKTEIYLHLIDGIMRKGKQVLYLVPEISLTPQIVIRLQKVFGNRIVQYHSKMSNAERLEIWMKVLGYAGQSDHSGQIILGARSALFLPFTELGLIIVDEEHENSYKQSDPAPRYNARDMATVLGHQLTIPVLLGSATPSFESYLNGKTGKYGLVTLSEKYGSALRPEILLADLSLAWKHHSMISFLTPELHEKIKNALDNREQIILFQNRRGYVPFVECSHCGWIPVCPNCDVSLTSHKKNNRLICHYCGYSIKMLISCEKCGTTGFRNRGLGTERIEEEIFRLFPESRISRMDADTTHSRTAYEKIIKDLENQKTDLLIGTQMVTKGLDFENVSVVGILNADTLLNFPDFRASERAYQLMAQVSGRAGRKNKQGTVVIQSSHPEHPLFEYLKNQDFDGFFTDLINERKTFSYPPWFRFIKVSVRHRDEKQAAESASTLAELFRQHPVLRVMGPHAPEISRIKLLYIREIWLKVSREHTGEMQLILKSSVAKVRQLPGNSSVIIQIDVDAM
jgi:primosomal protein N' (replication factor Y) (superfamily II helicase)